MLEVAKVLKLTLFSVRSVKTLTMLSPKFFSGDPDFFEILTTGTKGCIIQKSEGTSDVIA